MGKICKRLVTSTSVTVVGTSLVINIPAAKYNNCERICLLVAQPITGTPTRGMPVVITIGADATQYPLVKCNGNTVTQEFIGQNNIYPLIVQTNTTSAVFKVLTDICHVSTNLTSIPVTPAAGG